MLSFQRTRRTREHTGPTPHSVAIIGKMPSTKTLAERLILDQQRKEDVRNEVLQITKYNKLADFKNHWELATDQAIQKNTVQRRVEQILEADAIIMEEKRIRLRTMLAEEEDAYINEMEEKQETTEMRQEKMKEKAKILREKREKERLKIVERKLDERWRNQCEELRGVLCRRHQDEVCVDRMQQLALKSDLEHVRQEEERMYAELWEKDRLMKAAKEETDAQDKLKRNRAMVEILRTQAAAHEAKRMEEKRLIQEEALLLQEERKLFAMEEERARQNKKEQQMANRNALDKSVKLRGRLAEQERQLELALDLKILEELFEESKNVEQRGFEAKLRLRDEYKRYKEYLAKMKDEEDRLDAEVNRRLDEDVERTWQKKLARWRMEKEARNQLMQEVLRSRKEQLQEKLALMTKEKESLRMERESIAKSIEEHNRMDDESDARTREINKKHEADLLQQIAHQEQLKEQKRDQEWKEYRDTLDAEVAYQEKIKEILTSPEAQGRIHPFRRMKSSLNLSVTGTKLQ